MFIVDTQYNFLRKNYYKLSGEAVFETKLKEIKFKCKSDMFLMELSIWGTFGFADYKSGGRRGSDIDIHLVVY